MKSTSLRIMLITAIFIFAQTLHAQQETGPKLGFTKASEELGVISVDNVKPILLEIEFKNEGNEPLIVTSVRGCCGTRIKEYTKQPVLPGEKGVVKIEINPAPNPHSISRTVSIMSNDASGIKVFKVNGQVK